MGKIYGSVRNLLSFFCDGYIPLCNMRITTQRNSDGKAEYLECDLVKCRSEKQRAKDSPFYISADALKTNFDHIWKKWTELYETARPVASLFYGIVSGSSSGLNEFLNLTQALEVYSDRFRENELKTALNKRPKDIKLWERLKDLLDLYNSYLGITDTGKLADKLAKMRNYYTHYDKRRKEPTFSEVLAGGHILRTLLLIVIYSRVGVSDAYIIQARKIGTMQLFDDYYNLLLGKKNASNRSLTF